MSSAEDILAKYQGKIVPQTFHPGFITLSFVVSLIGATCTLELINRRTSTKGRYNQFVAPSLAANQPVLISFQSAACLVCLHHGRHRHLVYGMCIPCPSPHGERTVRWLLTLGSISSATKPSR